MTLNSVFLVLSSCSCAHAARRYCSVACYKAHDAACCEAFAKDSVTAELQGNRPTMDERKGMVPKAYVKLL